MSVLGSNETSPVVTPPAPLVTTVKGEPGILLPLPKADLPYDSVQFSVAGKVTVRYSRGEDSRPIPYPIEAE